jgi:EEF1A N-terminal glycine/lysine methyltransferase
MVDQVRNLTVLPSLLPSRLWKSERLPLNLPPVLELGAGTALPSLIAALSPSPSTSSPKRVVITDHPDPSIFNNLHKSVDTNRALLRPDVDVEVVGYEWGADPEPILALYASSLTLVPQSESSWT